jgi:hypothetical protein
MTDIFGLSLGRKMANFLDRLYARNLTADEAVAMLSAGTAE